MIKINGVEYDLPIEQISRQFEKTNKYSVVTEDGSKHSEVRAIYVNYTVAFDALKNEEYYSLIDALNTPDDVFSVTFPFNDDYVTLDCKITLGDDYIVCESNGVRLWSGIKITFESVNPWEV